MWRTPGARLVGEGLVVPLDRRRIVDAHQAGGYEGDGRQDDDDGGDGNTRAGGHGDPFVHGDSGIFPSNSGFTISYKAQYCNAHQRDKMV